jgi:hypothetical protein
MKNFIKPDETFPPINCKVFENYDHLDLLANKRGFFAVERYDDTEIETIGLVGYDNTKLHSGWVATMDDNRIKALDQLKTLKAKISKCLEQNEDIIIGFCQTGLFSIGYSIYRRRK